MSERLEEQLAETSQRLARLTGQLDIVIPRLDGLMPRAECEVRHEGLQRELKSTLEGHRQAIQEEIRRNSGGGGGETRITLKLIALAGAIIGVLGTAVSALGRVALHALGVSAGP